MSGPLAVLVAHDDESVVGRLRAALKPAELASVPDGFAATAEVARRKFEAIVIRHPLAEMDAFMITSWLRASGATCPIVVMADGAGAADIKSLEQVLDEGCHVPSDGLDGVVRVLGRTLQSTQSSPENEQPPPPLPTPPSPPTPPTPPRRRPSPPSWRPFFRSTETRWCRSGATPRLSPSGACSTCRPGSWSCWMGP